MDKYVFFFYLVIVWIFGKSRNITSPDSSTVKITKLLNVASVQMAFFFTSTTTTNTSLAYVCFGGGNSTLDQNH